MRPDMIAETEVEISTEDCCEEEEEEEIGTLMEDPEPGHEPIRKRKGRTGQCGQKLRNNNKLKTALFQAVIDS